MVIFHADIASARELDESILITHNLKTTLRGMQHSVSTMSISKSYVDAGQINRSDIVLSPTSNKTDSPYFLWQPLCSRWLSQAMYLSP